MLWVGVASKSLPYIKPLYVREVGVQEKHLEVLRFNYSMVDLQRELIASSIDEWIKRQATKNEPVHTSPHYQ